MESTLANSICTAGAHGPILVTVWSATPDVASLRQLAQFQQRWLAQNGAGLGAITVLGPGTGLALPADTRDEAARLQAKARGRVAAIATVVPPGGFRSSIIRSLLTGIALLSSLRAQEKVFSDMEAATTWLLARLLEKGHVVDRDALLQDIQELLELGSSRPSYVGPGSER